MTAAAVAAAADSLHPLLVPVSSGKTIKGHVFEDTWSRNTPQRLTTGGLLACWTRALQRMVVGDEWELICPGKMAYAQYGSARDSIGPNEVLMFRV